MINIFSKNSPFMSHIKPGTHQADADELVAMKADCGVGSRRQRLGPKLPWHTKLTLDTRRPSSTSVLHLSHALVRQLNSQSECSHGPTDRQALTPIQHVESAEKKSQLQPMAQNTLRNLVGRRTKTARRPTIGLLKKVKMAVSKRCKLFGRTVPLNERHLILAKIMSARTKQWAIIAKMDLWWTYSSKIPLLCSYLERKSTGQWINYLIFFGWTVPLN